LGEDKGQEGILKLTEIGFQKQNHKSGVEQLHKIGCNHDGRCLFSHSVKFDFLNDIDNEILHQNIYDLNDNANELVFTRNFVLVNKPLVANWCKVAKTIVPGHRKQLLAKDFVLLFTETS
jgi:hypothetical protein